MELRAGHAMVAVGAAPPMPPVLAESMRVDREIAAAQARARADAATLLARGPVSDEQVARFGIEHLPPVPGAFESALELAKLHQYKRTRTPEGDAMSRWLHAHGDGTVWLDWARTSAPGAGMKDAAEGVALVTSTLRLAATSKAHAKAHFARPRPYEVDPSLDPVFSRPAAAALAAAPIGIGAAAKNYCYPSGHSTEAYAGAVLASGLWPARSDEFHDMARRVAESRMYAGVHYASDVIAGAYLGTLVGAVALVRAGVANG